MILPFARKFLPPLLITAILFAVASPAVAIRIVDYNVLNFDPANSCTANRLEKLRLVMSAINADVVCTEEILGSSGANAFLNSVLNDPNGPGGYMMAPFMNGPDTDNALYYRNTVTVQANQAISTQPTGIRDWSYYRLALAGYSGTVEAPRLHIFIAHLKANDDQQAIREYEANVYRNWAEANLPAGAQVLCMGDFNLYSAFTEGAWTRFTETRATNLGRLRDPVDRVGAWHVNSQYSDVHTQAPQVSGSSTCPSYGCGYSGGAMDDRFDFILTGDSLHDNLQMDYFTGSYKAFGNDSLHYNKSINASPTIPEGQAMADALACASDHLPVVIDLKVPARLSAPASLAFGAALVGSTAQQDLTTQNSASIPGQSLVYNYQSPIPSNFSASTSAFIVAAGASHTQTITMLTNTPGIKSQSLTVNSTAPAPPTASVLLSGVVFTHAVPSTQSGSQVLSSNMSFGSHDVGGFTDQTAQMFNVGYNTFQSWLDVYAMQLTGDSRFSVVGFAPVNVTSTPATFTVHFDDAGASPGPHTGTLQFMSRDNTTYAGWTSLPALTLNLSATVTGVLPKGDLNHNGVVDSPDVPLLAALLLDPSAATPVDRDIADMNNDTFNDGQDLAPFVQALVP